MAAAANMKVVLLSQKDPLKEVELDPREGPFQSWLAVAQDTWGIGNLTPFDSAFASRAIGAMAPTKDATIGVVCYQLGHRLFKFSREGDIWLDAFEGEHALSQIEKRPGDKVKFSSWQPGKNVLGRSRFTHLAVLLPSRQQGPHEQLVREAAQSLKKNGALFLADLVAKQERAKLPGIPKLSSETQYRAWLEAAGLKLYSTHNLTDDVRGALLLGLHHSLGMLATARRLRQPWQAQRMAAYKQELEFVVALHRALDRGDIAAAGFFYVKGAT